MQQLDTQPSVCESLTWDLKWAQCSSCLITQTPSLPQCASVMFPPVSVLTFLCSLVHVWLENMHGQHHSCKEHPVLFVPLSQTGFDAFYFANNSVTDFGIFLIETRFIRFGKLNPFLDCASSLWDDSNKSINGKYEWKPTTLLLKPHYCRSHNTTTQPQHNCKR